MESPTVRRFGWPIRAKLENAIAFRGDGYFDIDSGLSKVFKITESQGVKFAWEVFNVTNSARFDVNPALLRNHVDGGQLLATIRPSTPSRA